MTRNGELVTMTYTYPEVTTIDTFYTTADGDLITPQTLEYGKGYSLVEVQAPYGYVLNSEPVYFDVVQEDSAEESGITVIEVVRKNVAQKGTIIVEKTGEVFSTVAGDKGLYQPDLLRQSAAWRERSMRSPQPRTSIHWTGPFRASKGEVVDTITTGADRYGNQQGAVSGQLRSQGNHGSVWHGAQRGKRTTVELVYAGQEVAVTETSTSFYNERQKVEIDLTKSLEVDEAYGVGNNGGDL